MPTTILFGETEEQAKARRFAEEADFDRRIAASPEQQAIEWFSTQLDAGQVFDPLTFVTHAFAAAERFGANENAVWDACSHLMTHHDASLYH